MKFNENTNDYFVAMLTIVATLNSVAIPLAYNIISENLKPYLDKNIYKHFISEKAFKCNVIVSIWGLPILGFPLLVDMRTLFVYKSISDVAMNIYILCTFFYMAGFLMTFIWFSKMIYEYAYNTDELIFKSIKKKLDAFF